MGNIKRRHLILYGCIGVSLFQAGMWVMADMPDKRQGWVIVFGIGLALLGSHEFAGRIMGMLAGLIRTRWMIVPLAVSVIGICFIEKFSISTSAAAFDGNMMQVTNAQNMSSPERIQLQNDAKRFTKRIEEDNAEINELRKTRNGIPADHMKNRAAITAEIKAIEYKVQANERKLNQANADMKNVNSSINSKAFDNLESSWLGMSQGQMALLFALLMSIVPLITAFLDGVDTYLKSNSNAGEAAPETRIKKSQRPLRSVA